MTRGTPVVVMYLGPLPRLNVCIEKNGSRFRTKLEGNSHCISLATLC